MRSSNRSTAPRRPLRLALAVTFVLALHAGTAGRLLAQPSAPPPMDFVLRPGDAVKLTVWRAPEFDGEFPVLPNGTLAHPYLRDIVVVGQPLAQVQAALEERARTQNQGAQVMLEPMLRVVVGGEVSSPNLYRHPAGTTVAEALVLAGGARETGNPRRVTLIRDGESTRIDLTDPTGPATRMPVASGDQLVIERRGRSFRESIVPITTVLGTAASIATLVIRTRR